MKKNIFSAVAALLILCANAQTGFAQEQDKKNATLLATWMVGGSSMLNTGFTFTGLDVDVVSKQGLKVTFGDLMNFKFDTGIYQNLYFGPGYHHIQDKFHVGGSLIFSPYAYESGGGDCLIGVKASGGYFVTPSIGISANFFFANGVEIDTSIVGFGAGLTIRL